MAWIHRRKAFQYCILIFPGIESMFESIIGKHYFWWYKKYRIAWNNIIKLYSSKVNNWVTCRNPTDRDAILVLLHLTLTPSSPDPEQLQGYKSRSIVNKRNSKEYRHLYQFYNKCFCIQHQNILYLLDMYNVAVFRSTGPQHLSLIHIWRCRRRG